LWFFFEISERKTHTYRLPLCTTWHILKWVFCMLSVKCQIHCHRLLRIDFKVGTALSFVSCSLEKIVDFVKFFSIPDTQSYDCEIQPQRCKNLQPHE
jgi:hypothetical protein